MRRSETELYDVVIAGAGPVGLFLACELRLRGCSVLVLEKSKERTSPLKDLPLGLRGLTIPTIESLDRRDLLVAIRTEAARRDTNAAAHWTRQARQPGGHFAGIQFFRDRIDTTQWAYRLPGPVSNETADLASIETVLSARGEALGAVVRRGFAVESLTQTDDDVTVHADNEAFGGRWLVGCDGARSRVRKASGIAFTGTDPEFTGYLALMELADPHPLQPGRQFTAEGMYVFTPPGTIAMADFDGGAFHRTDPVTRDHVQGVLRRLSGTDVVVTAMTLATTWTDRAFQAAAYRQGRVLLAGDAAHIHAPLGGQGLNLGIGDAMNLGWKLAATVQGNAPADLIDSYERERHPVGAQVLDWSRAQVVLMRPSRSSRALGDIVRSLAETCDGATYFAERTWGVGLRYDHGDDHELVGRSAPDFAFRDGTRLNEHLRGGRGVLVDFETRPALQALAGRWQGRFDYLAQDAVERLGTRAVLVRPDGIVAGVATDATPDDAVALMAVGWFGQPRSAPSMSPA